MKKFIIFILIILFCNNLKAQIFEDICSTEGSPALKSASLLDFNDISGEPIKYVRVNLVFLRKDDGTGGFQEDNPAHQQYINDKKNKSNYFMSNIPSGYDPLCYNGSSGTLSDSKIRFVYNMMYVNNTNAWKNQSSAITALNNSIVQNNLYPAISVFYTEDEVSFLNIVTNQNCPNTNTGIPSTSWTSLPTTNFNENLQVNMRGFFTKYYWMMNCVVGNSYWGAPDQGTVYGWLNAGRIEAHELCHNLNLIDIDKPNGECAQHLMMHNSQGYGNFLNPTEIADMHEALSLFSCRKYVLEDTYSSTPLSIPQNTTWSDNIRIYRGLNIQNSAQFQLTNELIIPSQVDILVQGASSFIASMATIHTPSTSSTLDLIVQQNSSVSLTNSTIQNCNVSIQSGALTLNNATIDISNSGNFSVALGSTLTFNSGSIQ